MSRIEKGTQRFKPAVAIGKRSSHAEKAKDSAAPRPAPINVPSRTRIDTPSRSASSMRIVPGQRRENAGTVASESNSGAGSSNNNQSAPTRTPTQVQQPSSQPALSTSSGIPSSGTARSYAFSSQPAKIRVPIQPRRQGLDSSPSESSKRALNRGASTLSPYERFLHAAQADPLRILQMDVDSDPSAIAEKAAEAWQCLDPAVRADYGAPGTTLESTASTTQTRIRGPRKRTNNSISDDEAEYQRQCAQHESGTMSMDSDLPPMRVDIGTTRMESIAVTNWRSGRASSRTFELERIRARQLKKRRDEALGQQQSQDGERTRSQSTEGQTYGNESMKPSGTPTPSDTPRETPAPDVEPQFGENRFAVQTRIVDGKIVLDEQSLFANYRDDEQQEREQRNWEVIDERESDQFINSATRGKQRRTQRWTGEETERFFHAISQWGTDFEMITRLFPRRTRREIKAKWTRESRQNPQRLDDAFQRRTAVDLNAYGQAAGVDLSGPPPVITPRTETKADVNEEVIEEDSNVQ